MCNIWLADAGRLTAVVIVWVSVNDIASVMWTRVLMGLRVSANINVPSSTTNRTRVADTSMNQSIRQVCYHHCITLLLQVNNYCTSCIWCCCHRQNTNINVVEKENNTPRPRYPVWTPARSVNEINPRCKLLFTVAQPLGTHDRVVHSILSMFLFLKLV